MTIYNRGGTIYVRHVALVRHVVSNMAVRTTHMDQPGGAMCHHR